MTSIRKLVKRAVPPSVVRAAREILPARAARTVERRPAAYSALALQAVVDHGDGFPGSMKLRPNVDERAVTLAGGAEVPRFIDHVDYERPPEDLVFVAVCNDKYAPGLEALLLSLQRVYPGIDNAFIVFHDEGLSSLSMHRIRQIYPAVRFELRDPSQYEVELGDAYNHRRVGLLGYLTLEALTMAEPSWVVILDTDLLVLGDISPLWQGTTAKAVPDAGVRPYALRSSTTGRSVINSGVISLPASERGPEAAARMDKVLRELAHHSDPLLNRFADQRFWNIYLAGRELELLPQNFNMNKVLYTDTFAGSEAGTPSILHMTGPKPWFDFILHELTTREDRRRLRKERGQHQTAFTLWNQLYHQGILKARVDAFRAEVGPQLDAEKGRADGRPVVLIGNGPSLTHTDMSAFDGYEKVAFNWFVRHEDFDVIRPDHLVLPSHMLFGGWHTPDPHLPQDFIDALTSHEHKPVLWISYYFKPYIDTIAELADFDIRYFLFEKPFKRRMEKMGWAPLDLYSPLVDTNTGVLTAGVPMALHFGATDIVIVGCDSNYSSASGSYFYEASQHSSATTREDTLLKTWTTDGPGQFGYRVTRNLLHERGVGFSDATVGGALTVLPKVTLDEVRAIASAAVRTA
ncbi:hypothetical protein [Demequina lignilytica]|uniref:Lipopolysaccharide biosynthesis protein, LPS:glycosyltransferase n=1 Tax=Demequina lignilytica TaxID=3051663 RepID=A0AB35MKG4_9MICO|nr:hypothetical protein [Demequina sp. SYSU T0a273]MDN4484316.1 hypothetical protein [Demequina sp. SYSU T0a273]